MNKLLFRFVLVSIRKFGKAAGWRRGCRNAGADQRAVCHCFQDRRD
ncbi:hypothetical protein KCP74_14900 [Salmonella enterica subsp. enterica]|nr:hypothetical protein KCP74_14900 [Salmonella enterica subsp. enterica]